MVAMNWQLIRYRLWKLWIRATFRKPCPACQGWGRVLRLDAGIMSRFGLKYWEECEACGGEKNFSWDKGRLGTGILSAPLSGKHG